MSLVQFTRQEVEKHNRKEDAMIIIDNVVYDVTQFLEEHPGGPEVLIDNAGKDVSQCFHDVGHGEEALNWRKQFVVGEVVQEEQWEVKRHKLSWAGGEDTLSVAGMISLWGPPVALAVASILLYMYLFP